MTDYFARFGAVRDYLRDVVEQARVDGYTTTIFGRRRPFPDLTSRTGYSARTRRAKRSTRRSRARRPTSSSAP